MQQDFIIGCNWILGENFDVETSNITFTRAWFRRVCVSKEKFDVLIFQKFIIDRWKVSLNTLTNKINKFSSLIFHRNFKFYIQTHNHRFLYVIKWLMIVGINKRHHTNLFQMLTVISQEIINFLDMLGPNWIKWGLFNIHCVRYTMNFNMYTLYTHFMSKPEILYEIIKFMSFTTYEIN